jgi:hypothetical protein
VCVCVCVCVCCELLVLQSAAAASQIFEELVSCNVNNNATQRTSSN